MYECYGASRVICIGDTGFATDVMIVWFETFRALDDEHMVLNGIL